MPKYTDFDLDLRNKKVETSNLGNNIKDGKTQPQIAGTYGPYKSCRYVCRLTEVAEECEWL